MATIAQPVSGVDCTRFHLSLNVNDLSKSVKFLTALLGVPPKKWRKDYAKFEPDDLPIVLSLEPRSTPSAPLRNTAGEGALNHVGIRMTDATQLVDVQRRLEAAGYTTQRQDGVECCYAKQTKFWIQDDDRTLWEVYVLDEDIDHRGGGEANQEPIRVTNKIVALDHPSAAPLLFHHRLSQQFPCTIPDSGQLDEVHIQGTWNAYEHQGKLPDYLAKIHQALKAGGRVFVHALTSNQEIRVLQPLPGPASAVKVVPQLSEVISGLKAAGFEEIQIVKYGSTPCFVQGSTEMRETRVVGTKRVSPLVPIVEIVRVLNKGPATVTLSDGCTIHGGEVAEIPREEWQVIVSSPLVECFVRLGDANHRTSCGIQ